MDSSDGTLNGIRVQLRMQIAREPEQRFDATGAELMQVRGQVLDRAGGTYPEAVVRFGGPRRAELWKWARQGKQLSVDGYLLEVKEWTARDGKVRQAILVDAQDIFPLTDIDDLSKLGIYAERRGRGGKATAAPKDKAAQADRMRTLLDRADA